MTTEDLNDMLKWCKMKLNRANSDWDICSSDKRLEGYEMAMKSVMSYLHTKKLQNIERSE